jgi:hypothetical protein
VPLAATLRANGTTSVVMIVGRSSKTVAFVATLALTTFGALATASAPTPREAAPSGTTVMRSDQPTPTTQQPAAPPAAPDVNSRGPLRGLQVGAEPAIAASPKPWPLSDRSGGEPIPNVLAYAAQPTPIATARTLPMAFGTPRAASTAPPAHLPNDRGRGVKYPGLFAELISQWREK